MDKDQYNNAVELRYYGRGSGAGAPMHRHAYYQLEYCTAGELHIRCALHNLVCRTGEFVLIPPGMYHKFANRKDVKFLSLKFSAPENMPLRCGSDPMTEYYLDLICRIIDMQEDFPADSLIGKRLINNHLNTIFRLLQKSPPPPTVNNFDTELNRVISELGANTQVGDLAEHFHLSRAEFKYLFAREHGSGDIKKYIIEQVLQQAETLMIYSDLKLDKIAGSLHFSSVYAFSRCYKKNRNLPPSVFRPF